MPRIRSIKPEFFEDEKVGAVSRDARLLFICTWMLADDYGNLRAAPRLLRLQAFPFDDDLTDGDVMRMLNQLMRRGMLRLYEVKGEQYANVVHLDRHQYQKPGRKKVAKCPNLSDDESKEIKQLQGVVPDKSGQDYPSPALPLSLSLPRSLPRRGSEEPLSNSAEPKPDVHAAAVEEVFEHWRLRLNHPRTKLTADRKGKIRARLRDGYSVEDLKEAIDGCCASAYHMGDNDAGKRYDAIGLIFRNADKVDQFRGYLNARPRPRLGAQRFESTKPSKDNGLDQYRRKINDPETGPDFVANAESTWGDEWWTHYGFESDPREES